MVVQRVNKAGSRPFESTVVDADFEHVLAGEEDLLASEVQHGL